MPKDIALEFDMKPFRHFMRDAQYESVEAMKDAQDRAAAKMRKEFVKIIDTKNFEKLQETDKYKSKYDRPLQMLKGMIRYRTKRSKSQIISEVGIFAGKTKGTNLNNARFKARYGVTVMKFGRIMTYGGNLAIRTTAGKYTSGRKRMVKQGFKPRKGTQNLRFPKRDWFTPNRWRRSSVIMPYWQKHFNLKMASAMKKYGYGGPKK